MILFVVSATVHCVVLFLKPLHFLNLLNVLYLSVVWVLWVYLYLIIFNAAARFLIFNISIPIRYD